MVATQLYLAKPGGIMDAFYIVYAYNMHISLYPWGMLHDSCRYGIISNEVLTLANFISENSSREVLNFILNYLIEITS